MKVIQSIVSLIIGLIHTSCCTANDIVKDFSLPTAMQYDDNVTLASTNTKGAFRYIMTPTLDLFSVDEVDTFNIRAALNIVRSNASKDLILDREDPALNASWNHKFGKGSFSLKAGYLRSSTRVSELEQTGIVFRDGNSINRTIGGSLNYELTERFDAILTLDYTKQKYAQSALSDFKSYATGFQLNYDYTEKLNFSLNTGYSKFNNQQTGQLNLLNQNESSQNLKRYSAGVSYLYSPELSINLSIGGNDVSTGERGWVASSELSFQPSDYTTLNASFSRGNYASGLGGFQNSDNFNVDLTKVISVVDKVGCSFFWNRNRNLNTSTVRGFFASYSHEWTPSWSSKLTFQHRSISSGVVSGSAAGAQLGFALEYNLMNF